MTVTVSDLDTVAAVVEIPAKDIRQRPDLDAVTLAETVPSEPEVTVFTVLYVFVPAALNCTSTLASANPT